MGQQWGRRQHDNDHPNGSVRRDGCLVADVTFDRLGLLLEHLTAVCDRLERHGGLLGDETPAGFHH